MSAAIGDLSDLEVRVNVLEVDDHLVVGAVFIDPFLLMGL